MLRRLNTGIERQIIMAAEGTGQHVLAHSKFKNMDILVPYIDEQKYIGKYFEFLDRLITLHQSKSFGHILEVIVSCTLSWEQRKLSEVYKNICNAYVGTATPYYVEDGHFYLEANNVKDGKINYNSQIFINDNFYESQKDKWLNSGDIVMVQSGHVGHAAVIPKELENTVAHALIIFKNAKIKIEPYFLNYQYQTLNFKRKIENITVGNTIKHILASDMKEYMVYVSRFAEQSIVSKYFQTLDHLITLHQLEPFQLIFKAIAYRIIDYAKSKPPRCRKYTGLISFIKYHI